MTIAFFKQRKRRAAKQVPVGKRRVKTGNAPANYSPKQTSIAQADAAGLLPQGCAACGCATRMKSPNGRASNPGVKLGCKTTCLAVGSHLASIQEHGTTFAKFY
jgi:hypothetical protein